MNRGTQEIITNGQHFIIHLRARRKCKSRANQVNNLGVNRPGYRDHHCSSSSIYLPGLETDARPWESRKMGNFLVTSHGSRKSSRCSVKRGSRSRSGLANAFDRNFVKTADGINQSTGDGQGEAARGRPAEKIESIGVEDGVVRSPRRRYKYLKSRIKTRW